MPVEKEDRTFGPTTQVKATIPDCNGDLSIGIERAHGQPRRQSRICRWTRLHRLRIVRNSQTLTFVHIIAQAAEIVNRGRKAGFFVKGVMVGILIPVYDEGRSSIV